ncbi:DUF3791 domain-containing protein [Subdoligranulum sp. AF14-43]|nr:DUF3791 domain-containing protein [Subdoligranulum sp. AF14-43]
MKYNILKDSIAQFYVEGGAHLNTEREEIRNFRELEFSVFCIESIAAHLGVDAQRVYSALTEKSDILNSYIVPEYEMLHTQSKEYIVCDILDVMKEQGVEI